jgi:hypothetical protein
MSGFMELICHHFQQFSVLDSTVTEASFVSFAFTETLVGNVDGEG